MKKLPALLVFASSFALADSLAPVIDNSSYPTGGVQLAQNPVSSSMNSTFELMTRLDEAQAEIQQLNGKIEEQTYLISELKKKQSAMFADFDDRLQQIENKASSAKSAETPEPATTKTVEPVSEAAPPPPKPTAASSVPAAGSQTPYQEAFAAFRNGQVTEAINQFNTLLSKDPNNQLANNAQFWLGEAYRVNKDIPSAKKAFSAVLEKYPSSQKVPDALLKLGGIEMDAKNSAKAKELFTRVITDYPTSKSAEVAAKKLQQLNGTP
jgi:tol-pal system protein YbgF